MNRQALLKRLEKIEERLKDLNSDSLEEIMNQWFDFIRALLTDEELEAQINALSQTPDFKTFRYNKDLRMAIRSLLEQRDDDG